MLNNQANLYIMKKILILISITLFFLCISCEEKIQSSSEFALINVDKNYSFKELILQNFMDVEYILLETNADFLCEGFVQDVGKKYIIVRNFKHTGDIFIFDRQGRAVKKFNRRGQGGEEYVILLEVVLDEKRSELFVNDWGRKIVVYDLDGNYKRSFKAKENAKYRMMRNFNEDYLICYDDLIPDVETEPKQAMLLVSKQDGQYQEIKMPFEKKELQQCLLRVIKMGWYMAHGLKQIIHLFLIRNNGY